MRHAFQPLKLSDQCKVWQSCSTTNSLQSYDTGLYEVQPAVALHTCNVCSPSFQSISIAYAKVERYLDLHESQCWCRHVGDVVVGFFIWYRRIAVGVPYNLPVFLAPKVIIGPTSAEKIVCRNTERSGKQLAWPSQSGYCSHGNKHQVFHVKDVLHCKSSKRANGPTQVGAEPSACKLLLLHTLQLVTQNALLFTFGTSHEVKLAGCHSPFR